MTYSFPHSMTATAGPGMPREVCDVSKARLERFTEYQDRLASILTRGEQVLAAQGEPDVAAIGKVRWELSRAIREYQLFKHMMIFDPMIAAGHARAGLAREMKAECVAAGEAYRAYLSKWTAISILDHWDEYYPAALALSAEVRRIMAREHTRMAQLLAD